MTSELRHEVNQPFSDADIRDFLPDAQILKYSDLNRYSTLENLLPRVKSYFLLLYLESPNAGHWVLVSRPEQNQVEYFDSYGGYPDSPLLWTSPEKREKLGTGEPYLSMLFRQYPGKVVFNKVKYQKQEPGISNCGRWCVLRALKMKAGMNLSQFHEYVKRESKKADLPWDLWVTKLID